MGYEKSGLARQIKTYPLVPGEDDDLIAALANPAINKAALVRAALRSYLFGGGGASVDLPDFAEKDFAPRSGALTQDELEENLESSLGF